MKRNSGGVLGRYGVHMTHKPIHSRHVDKDFVSLSFSGGRFLGKIRRTHTTVGGFYVYETSVSVCVMLTY